MNRFLRNHIPIKVKILLGFVLLFQACQSPTNEITVSTKVISVDSLTIAEGDKKAEEIINYFKSIMNDKLNDTIAFTNVPLTAKKPSSPLSNLIADVVLEEATNNKLGLIPDCSIINFGGLRADLPKGYITVRNAFELMPFENEIVLVKISGETLTQGLNLIASQGGQPVSNLSFTIENGKATQIRCKGNKIVPDHKYLVATSDFLAEGGDHMTFFKTHDTLYYIQKSVRTAIIENFSNQYKNGKSLAISKTERIKTNE